MKNAKIDQLVLLVKQAERIVQELGILSVDIDGIDGGARVHFPERKFPFKNAKRKDHSDVSDEIVFEIDGIEMFHLTDKEDTEDAII